MARVMNLLSSWEIECFNFPSASYGGRSQGMLGVFLGLSEAKIALLRPNGWGRNVVRTGKIDGPGKGIKPI